MIFVVEVDDDAARDDLGRGPPSPGADVDPPWLAGPVSDDGPRDVDRLLHAVVWARGSTTGKGSRLADDTLQEFGLKCEAMWDVVVVTPQVAGLDDEPSIDALRDGLDAPLDRTADPSRGRQPGPRRPRSRAAAIGVLLVYHLRLDRAGGAAAGLPGCLRVAAMP